jgi:hypothetical protein
MRINWIRIRIQHSRLNTDPDRRFWWPKIYKNLPVKNFYFIFFWSKIAIFLSLGLHKGRPSYRRKPSALKREQIALQTMNFLIFFQFFRAIFALMAPGSGSEFRIWIRIHWPDWIRIQNTALLSHLLYLRHDLRCKTDSTSWGSASTGSCNFLARLGYETCESEESAQGRC